jgi:hypothetical protein
LTGIETIVAYCLHEQLPPNAGATAFEIAPLHR